MQLDGKRIVLTGAASGIGQALLVRLSAFDVEIIAADRDAERLGETVRHPQNVRASINPFVCDLGDEAGNEQLFAHALATMGGIDIFFANAGFAYYERIAGANWTHIDRIFGVNTFTPIYAALKMAEINPQHPYMTVITASTMAHWGLPGYALYGATKAALQRFADAYRHEMPTNGQLIMVYPVATDTGFFEAADAPVGYPLQGVEPVADAILRGVQRNQANIYPSQLWQVTSFLNRFVPLFKPLTQRLYARTFKAWEDGR
jgi:short-subunit dehydrogenase